MKAYRAVQRLDLFLPIILCLFSVGCGTRGVEPEAVEQPGELSFQQDMVFGSGPFTYTDTAAGLADLTSYEARLTMSFSGTRAGKPEQWARTYVLRSSKEPAVRALTIETSGDVPGVEPVFIAEAGGLVYQQIGDGSCSANGAAEGQSSDEPVEPAALLTPVVGADAAGSETIGEIPADHYTFDQKALGEEGLTESVGELWIASAEGYLIRYKLQSTGAEEYLGEGLKGTLSWDYELSGINLTDSIALPPDCPPGLIDAPVMEDAQDPERSPGLTWYATASDVPTAMEYYNTALPGLGWQPDGEPLVGEELTVVEFARGTERLTILLGVADGKTEVRMLLGAAGETSPLTP